MRSNALVAERLDLRCSDSRLRPYVSCCCVTIHVGLFKDLVSDLS